MAAQQPPLISLATRSAFREHCSSIIARHIHNAWESQGFAPALPEDIQEQDGVRRTVFQSYAQTVDWTDQRHVERALVVFEDLIRHAQREGWVGHWLDELVVPLKRDGLRLAEDGRIEWVNPPHRSRELSQLADASGILAELQRVHHGLSHDPAAAIGSAKQLIEATAKTVLNERGVPIDRNAKIPALVRQAQQALLLDPGTGGPDGTDAVKRILGGAATAALGVAELRNLYGTGHGQASVPGGLSVRHARLAVNAAFTWCELLLDTLHDPDAPWRKQDTTVTAGN